MKVKTVLKVQSKHLVKTATAINGEYDFSEHITWNLGCGNEHHYEKALADLIAADDFEAVLKKSGKISKYRDLSDYDDDRIRDIADNMLHLEGVDLLEGQ